MTGAYLHVAAADPDYHGPALWVGRCITCQRMIQRGEPVIAGSRADAILGIHFHPWCFTGWF